MSGQPLFLGRSGNPDDSIDASFASMPDVNMDPSSEPDLDTAADGDGAIQGEATDAIEAEDASTQPASQASTSASNHTAPLSQDDLPPDSDLVASLPVYLSNSLLDTSSLHLFQYPVFPRERPLPVPFSAASRGLKVSSRWRPKANRVEVDLPLDVREEVYNMDKGADFGVGADLVAQKQARIDAAYQGSAAASGSGSGSSGYVKKEKQEEERLQRERGPKRLDKTRLDSVDVPKVTNYMVGVIRDQALHLTPLSSVVQLRPSMHYLDALDEAREAEKRRDRAAAAGEAGSDDDDDDDLIEMEATGPGSTRKKAAKKEDKKPAAQTLSVAMRGDPNAAKGGAGGGGGGGGSEGRDHLMAAQREADAERWIDLEWRDEESAEAQEAFQAQLFAGSKKKLVCQTKPREYLIEVEP
ncbi:uncharacterized protein PFL1_04920 [Pseudozyma flocculosa PF-1]|uniref:Related to RPC37 - RNA polymerase III subunit C37 n=2 Tax=Pseudozyma flocculosa TaxID=84751 RepID=A0A5C3EVX6_9BASI|nr:uncharacterized protein PFL1_04920 [Pseudozyma flocculosa PF-1]EPQ27381.1 hypothetical protein PFL1_04920 [Pseudozyma flocculosa PF-1]SPO36202.1 related to RPC37 - RNA polymerase III subunit C37 [Pseudozyma flocculosa]